MSSRTRVTAWAALILAAGTAIAQPVAPTGIPGQPVQLSFDRRVFDGVVVDSAVFTARSLQMFTDNLGAWTPYGEGTTGFGFAFEHRTEPGVFLTFAPCDHAGPGRDAESWIAYLSAASRSLGPDTTIEQPTDDGGRGETTSFASWPVREATFVRPTGNGPARAQRHLVATDGDSGVVFILTGSPDAIDRVDDDFRFLLARLARRSAPDESS